MIKIIAYAIHNDGYVVSRVGSELAWPVLQYDQMKPENNFKIEYKLEKMPVSDVPHEWYLLKWTKKIPLSVKNAHREFWGMKPLPLFPVGWMDQDEPDETW